jgi:hypothetical protein
MKNAERKIPLIKSREEKIACNTRLYRTDVEKVAEISVRLRLERSEIIRRAIREGLRFFDEARLPGTK